MNQGSLVKVELASGQNPQPGYLHVEMSPDFPQVDYVCDIVSQRLPFENSSVDELIHNHFIEHVPWRRLPFVVREWARVMKPGAALKIRTPDLRFICQRYLTGEITPEWPSDESAMREVFGHCGASQWAMIKLFSGQDYPGNFHFHIHDIDSLRALLERHGFRDVQKINLGVEFSPGELQVIAWRS
jgi:predicted SAM-dependent methyltransferase